MADQEPEPPGVLTEVHHEVAGLLAEPAAVRPCGRPENRWPATLTHRPTIGTSPAADRRRTQRSRMAGRLVPGRDPGVRTRSSGSARRRPVEERQGTRAGLTCG
jgi:hypothetical protein